MRTVFIFSVTISYIVKCGKCDATKSAGTHSVNGGEELPVPWLPSGWITIRTTPICPKHRIILDSKLIHGEAVK